ncbi:RNHCP domain-containing protein [Bailinhaonella thermotolerans]|uniref:RNHCP domain-containing protein n=1 Tax=Bailinhaonella thermotolerans TaxID=1070861 RepID=A0A3A4B4L5_9ACTN|nr:RNHCP domain-containing protein [Bailinhaonella thermotolerans]RJL26492.1 RNHCP domain-containing protein [Bailinhaonella thermotolerans]
MPRRKPGRNRPQRPKPSLHAPGADAFRCAHCRLDVPLAAPGTAHRNHCPHCLTSLHLDRDVPGDRRAACGGRMRPISLTTRPDGEWLIIHECAACGTLSANRIAGDDNPLPLIRLALRPLTTPHLLASDPRLSPGSAFPGIPS